MKGKQGEITYCRVLVQVKMGRGWISLLPSPGLFLLVLRSLVQVAVCVWVPLLR